MTKRAQVSFLALGTLLITALCLTTGPSRALGAELEGFESDDEHLTQPSDAGNTLKYQFEEITIKDKPAAAAQEPAQHASQSGHADADSSEAAAEAQARRRRPAKKQSYVFEICIITFFIAYMVAAGLGHYRNAKMAKAWAKLYATPGSIFDKHFIMTAGEDGELTQDGSVYKFYAKGRRHCEGVLATLNLGARDNLLNLIWSLLSPSDDTMDVEVYMNETSMPQIVLAVGTPKASRQLLSNCNDVKKFTRRLNINSEATRGWPNARLCVMAEHSSIFTDLFSDPRVLSVFTTQQHALALRHFRYVHVTADNGQGSYKRVLRFQFALPAASEMGALMPLVAMIPALIDAVGMYRLPADIKKKIGDARAKVEAASAAEEDERRARMDKIQQRKMDKLREEKERIAKLPPDVRQKIEEKQARQAAKKQFRAKVTRVG